MPRKSAKTAALEAENARLRAQLAAATADRGDSEVAAPLIREVEKPKLSGTVTVACKVPQGLKLQLQHQEDVPVPTGRSDSANSYKMMKQWVFGGPVFYVFGPSMPVGAPPKGYALPEKLEGGYALTHGIPAAFWAEWVEQNRLAPYVENKMIFAMDAASTVSAAREHREVKSGLEPICYDVDSKGNAIDKRLPRSTNSRVARVGLTDQSEFSGA